MPPTSTARLRLLEAMIAELWERSYGSVSVDSICERADVRKGSFYHFFKSKTALAVAAIDYLWETHSRPHLDDVFSSSHPPLRRFERLIESCYQKSVDCLKEKGKVLGCPYINIGAETACAEPEIAAKLGEILTRYQGYIEATLHEANARGDTVIEDPSGVAGCIFSMIEGSCIQSRIHNDPDRVRHLADSFSRMIGAELHPNLPR